MNGPYQWRAGPMFTEGGKTQNFLKGAPIFRVNMVVPLGEFNIHDNDIRLTHPTTSFFLLGAVLFLVPMLEKLYQFLKAHRKYYHGKILNFIPGKGDVFGENFSMTTKKPIGKSKASIRALTYCDLHAIGREDALYIIRAYPDFRKNFADMQTSFELRDLEVRIYSSLII